MRWDVWDFVVGAPVALGTALVGVAVLYPATGWVVADDIRPGMTRGQVAAKLGTDGEYDPKAFSFASVGLSPNSQPPPDVIARAHKAAGLRMWVYPCRFHTIRVCYDGDRVESAYAGDLDWSPGTWPGALKGLLALAPLVCAGAELSRRGRRWWTLPPFPSDDCCP